MNMVYLRLLVLYTFTVLIFYLDTATSERTKPYTESATLLENGTKKVCNDITLHVNFIHDSRCPADVVCDSAGRADVQLLFSEKRASSTVDLMVGYDAGESIDSAQVTMDTASYLVICHDVVPYPGTGSAPTKAVVQVRCP
jgi:hypothetical protein